MFTLIKTGKIWQNKDARLMLVEWLLILIAVTIFLIIIFLIKF
jgi:cell division protein FtsL